MPPSYGFAAPNVGVPLTSAISYQGRLVQNGAPVNATCDFIFALYDASSGGAQIGANVNQTLQVQQGLFSLGLDFGAGAYNGPMRWLSTQVRCPTNSGGFTTQAVVRVRIPPRLHLIWANGASHISHETAAVLPCYQPWLRVLFAPARSS